MAKLLLGKEVTDALNEKLMERTAALKEQGIIPTLAIIRCGANPSDLSYEKGATKRAELVGVAVKKYELPEDVTKEALMATIDEINGDDSVHGVLMFRPLPKHLKADQDEICNRLDPKKDVDCMTDLSNAGVFEGRKDLGYAPCTPEACMEILDYYGIDCKGKSAVVIGRSLVVGKPAAMMLMGKNATVTVCHTKTVNTAEVARSADILVSAAGVLGSLTKEYVRPGQVVIDVSINWDPEKINSKGGESLHLKKEFEIRQLTSLHYFEYKSDFIFKSEYHDYWKLLYVEDGSAEISFSNKKQAPVTLQKGELFIQSPNEYYSFRASSGNIAVLFTAGFYSDTANLSLLANKKLVCQKKETELLQALALEGKSNFSPKINPASPAALERRYNQPFGGEQLIGIYLEMLLISLMRQYTSSEEKKETPSENTKKDASASLLKTDSIQPNHRLL